MDDIAYADEDLASNVRELEEGLATLKGLSGNEKLREVVRLEGLVKNINASRRLYQMSLRSLEGDAMRPYQIKLDVYDRQVESVKTELKWARKEAENSQARSDLFGDRAERGEMPPQAPNIGRDEMLNAAHATQDKTGEALGRIKRTAGEMNETADNITERLAQQRDQLHNINEGLIQVQTELDLAKDIMSSFVKRVMTDKLIVIIVVLIVLGFCGLGIYLGIRDKV
mmetsp:Transcript_2591/g.6035  ORF Transcript_2591/g.6035 Transcript_2591/m.6035 type:complete len:227 (+) Transcript_2591:483-1163(+)|eukprot:CAMPEP_0171503666 /NCGR_PEP_ID=MMETSP0958-20121227/11041_1 /TAXON_ID=87120 /ORGANISM="Aurantiochytrium limacinum, Strain ATCCMYA-1381" /LENGTH=226 /DNA_ID=CAMNT_0012039219 /DNA_START=376 /DNA_END=1056 /DNA_ORIENTATION=-